MWRLQRDWYSPTRLSDVTVDYDFPGDRFIPNRSLMNHGYSLSMLTNSFNKLVIEPSYPHISEGYRRKLERTLMQDSDGRPFKMLDYRGIPKSRRKTGQESSESYVVEDLPFNYRPNRVLPKSASRILQAPELRDDFYLNVLDWGRLNNLLAVGLGSDLYVWNGGNRHVFKLLQTELEEDYVTSLAWSPKDSKLLAVGFDWPEIQIWDCETYVPVRNNLR